MPFFSTADGAWPPYLTLPHLHRRILQLRSRRKIRRQKPKELDHEQLKEKGYILRDGLLWVDYDPGQVRGPRVESYLRSSSKPHYVKGTNFKSCLYPNQGSSFADVVVLHLHRFHQQHNISPLRQAAASAIGPVTEMYRETFESGIILTVIDMLERDFTRL